MEAQSQMTLILTRVEAHSQMTPVLATTIRSLFFFPHPKTICTGYQQHFLVFHQNHKIFAFSKIKFYYKLCFFIFLGVSLFLKKLMTNLLIWAFVFSLFFFFALALLTVLYVEYKKPWLSMTAFLKCSNFFVKKTSSLFHSSIKIC